jgi:hypothetical protein
MQWLSSRHVMAATDTHATMNRLKLFSVRSVPMLYNEDQLPLPVSRESLQAVSWEAGTWGRGQIGNPGEGERPPLEAATKQRSEESDWEH